MLRRKQLAPTDGRVMAAPKRKHDNDDDKLEKAVFGQTSISAVLGDVVVV